jgi:hypothetical protein
LKGSSLKTYLAMQKMPCLSIFFNEKDTGSTFKYLGILYLRLNLLKGPTHLDEALICE